MSGILGDITPTPKDGGERKPASKPAEKPKPFDFAKFPLEPPKLPDPDPQDRR